MNIGISTACLYPMYTEKALETLLGQGFRLFEIFFNTLSELEPEFVSHLGKMLEQKGAVLKSIHPFTSGFESYLLFSNYERRFEDGIKFYNRYFETAARLGAKILVLHGDRSPEKSGLDVYKRQGQYCPNSPHFLPDPSLDEIRFGGAVPL